MSLLEELQKEKLAKEEQIAELEAELKSLQEQLVGLKVKLPVEEIEAPVWRKYLPYIVGGGVVATIIYFVFKK